MVQINLEYCVPFWSSNHQKDIAELEKVQKTVIKMTNSLEHLSY